MQIVLTLPDVTKTADLSSSKVYDWKYYNTFPTTGQNGWYKLYSRCELTLNQDFTLFVIHHIRDCGASLW